MLEQNLHNNSKQDILNNYLKLFFILQLTNKLYHWNTTSFARHKATDEFNDIINDFIDKFVEYYIGRNKCKPSITSIKTKKEYLTDTGFIIFFEDIKILLDNMNKIINDEDLLAIKDELLGEVNKMLYLLNLS